MVPFFKGKNYLKPPTFLSNGTSLNCWSSFCSASFFLSSLQLTVEKADIRKRFWQQQTSKLSNKFGRMIKQTDVPCMQNKNLNLWFYILLTEFNRVKFTKSIPTSNRRKKRQRIFNKILRKVTLVWLIEDSYVQGLYDLVINMECNKKSNVSNISADIPPLYEEDLLQSKSEQTDVGAEHAPIIIEAKSVPK